MEALEKPSDERRHASSKRVKDLRYRERLLEAVWPEVMRARPSASGEPAELLGAEHDLAALREALQAGRRALREADGP